MEINLWTIVIDFGLMSGLILFSQLVRSKIKLLQTLFLPAGLIAGLIGLIIGPNGLGIVPFSSIIGSYAGILIVLVFATLPIGQEKISLKEAKEGIGNMWAYSLLVYVGQHLLAMLLGLLIFIPFFKTHPGFAFMLPAGFVGGHGTAAAVGTSFNILGWEEATSLGMTSATVGIISGLIGGIILIKWATKMGATKYIKDFSQLPNSLRTGLLNEQERPNMGKETFSSISVDSLTMHFALILFVSVIAKYVANIIIEINPKLSLPVFTIAVLVGFIVQAILNVTGGNRYIDKRVITRIGSTCTDYLVAFGVASIKLPIVIKYVVPLILLFGVGILFNIFVLIYLAPRMFKKGWFEKGIYSYGWASGTTAIGITLLRITDPGFESKTLDDFSIGYLLGAMPAELLIVTLAPLFIASGMYLQYTGILALVVLFIIIVCWKARWFYTRELVENNQSLSK